MEIKEQIEILNKICPFYHKFSSREIRHEFFENIQTEIQAYLLGFFVADGHISNTRNTLAFNLSSADAEILYLYKDYISKNAYMKITNKENYNAKYPHKYTNDPIRLNISSKKITESLFNLGYKNNKTYDELHIPKISKELIRHFIRGYFDGDGCVTGYARKPNPKNREKNWRFAYHADFTSKTKTLLVEIQNILQESGIDSGIYFAKKDQTYRLNISNKHSLEKFYHYLYDDSNFYLKRKYLKFNHYVNTEVTQLIDEYRNAQKVNVSESNNPSTSTELPTDNSGKMMCAEQ